MITPPRSTCRNVAQHITSSEEDLAVISRQAAVQVDSNVCQLEIQTEHALARHELEVRRCEIVEKKLIKAIEDSRTNLK